VQEKSFLLDVWFQCFLVGVHKLVFCLKAKGRCTGDLTVVDIKEFDPDSLISFCEVASPTLPTSNSIYLVFSPYLVGRELVFPLSVQRLKQSCGRQ